MDSPQYNKMKKFKNGYEFSFKPYYKWIVLNTLDIILLKEMIL